MIDHTKELKVKVIVGLDLETLGFTTEFRTNYIPDMPPEYWAVMMSRLVTIALNEASLLPNKDEAMGLIADEIQRHMDEST